MRRVPPAAIACAALAAAAAWWLWPGGHERAIRRELSGLVALANERPAEGVGRLSRAADLAKYFTEDVVVDPGGGRPPVVGRQAIVAAALRLYHREEGTVAALEDVSVTVRDGDAAADVRATATLTFPETGTEERSIDARELAIEMRNEGGRWRISRAAAVDVLR